MGNYSKNPQTALQDALQKGYSRVRFQQGKPILDRELNLAADLAAPNRALRHYLGNGVPEGSDGFSLGNPNPFTLDFTIKAGRCLVNGLEAVLNSNTTYRNQPHKENLRAFPAGMSFVYLRTFTVEVNETQDPDLKNAADIGFETALRERADWEVFIAPDYVIVPEQFLLGILLYYPVESPPPPPSEIESAVLKFFQDQPVERALAEKGLAEVAVEREKAAKRRALEEKALVDAKTIVPIPPEPEAYLLEMRVTGMTMSRVHADLGTLMNPERTRLADNSVLVRSLSSNIANESSVTVNGGQTATIMIMSAVNVGPNPWLLLSVWGTGQFSWTERSVNGDRLLFITNLVNNAPATVHVKALKLNF